MDRNYCVNQVYRDIRSDRQFRLLWVDPSTAGSYIYWLDGKPSVPKMLGLQELELGVQQGWIAEDQDPFVLHGNASEKDKQFRDVIWNKMRDALQDEPGIYDRNIRADHLRRIEQESGERVSNLYRHLSRYWSAEKHRTLSCRDIKPAVAEEKCALEGQTQRAKHLPTSGRH